jgi:D-tyrosyl-tRNA(Tyr) deacylase
MRAVIQRVNRASVTVEQKIIGEIEVGLLILLGVQNEDTDEDLNWLVKKILQLRIFSDENGLMNKNISEINGNFLVISQFTLFAQTKKGNRPSFIRAGSAEFSEKMYEKFIDELGNLHHKKIQTGKFAANMKVELVNDGPVTICIDTKNKE